jgi:dephospho-CoA kinase
MKVCGLTGGVGMGKSASAQMLQEHGVCVIDTDVLARQLVQPGQPALLEIQETFDLPLLDDSGRLHRHKLAQLVFSDLEARRKLEAILHPRIRGLWLAKIEQWRYENQTTAVVIIPLLFETGAEVEFDETICVACSMKTQWSRLQLRGWNDSQITQRIAAQWPVEKKMAQADYVVWTDCTLETTAEQLRRIVFSK